MYFFHYCLSRLNDADTIDACGAPRIELQMSDDLDLRAAERPSALTKHENHATLPGSPLVCLMIFRPLESIPLSQH